MSSINLQESQLSGCEKHIAIVVDESGSINITEAQQIKDGLTSFINSQTQSNITLSLIGMSNSDTAVRSDNVIQKKIADNQQDFLDWINQFGNGRANIQSDYWASGFNEVKNLAVTPDIVFVVTDGIQINNSELLKGLFTDLNLKSQVFVYGVTSTLENISELITPLNTFLGRTPRLKDSGISALESDYIRVPDFSTLGTELNNLITDLSTAQTGCIPNVSVIENKIVYPILKKGVIIKQEAGSLVLRNKSRIPLTLITGTKIHSESSLNGLIFTLQNTVTIPGSGQIEAVVRIEGKPLTLGNFSAPIILSNVKNPLGFSINFNVGKESVIDINPSKTNLQSTYLQIAAAGSRGVDSTKGIHLRWMLTGKLGEKHLPKGDLYTGLLSNFNKPDDFVKVYRAPYVKKSHLLDLSQKPNVVDNKKGLWIYKTTNSTRSIYVIFHNITKYKSVKLAIDPLVNPVDFIEAYGNNLIEIENKSELFFATELNFLSVNNSGNVKLETLSVSENSFTAAKRVSNRKSYASSQVENIRLVSENGRSIRFKANNCLLNSVSFEFYSDFITQANTNGDWSLKGKYALSDNDSKVFKQLEPKLNAVHGKWLKYNDGDYVNIANYKDKWNRPTVETDNSDKNIKQILSRYLTLSTDPNNPTASEIVNFGDLDAGKILTEEEQLDDERFTKISYLDLLNIAANDYHIARMLGLGCIDMDDEVLSGEFVYLTEYTTLGDLDGTGANERQHLSMSIPTSLNTERQSLPVQLSKIVPGLNMDSDESQTTKITDPEGYSFDGKKRYVSLFMNDVMDYDISKDNKDFFKSTLEYDGSSFTFPVYLGVDFKIKTETEWRKPELSHDLAYKNINKDLEESTYEAVPIIIPESGKSIINIRQEEVGKKTYIYQGYGINIFSRATAGRQISIESDITPANNLIPPSNINSLLITEESPLMFTSASEQQLLNQIKGNDKTLVRILFDYYSAQELLSYTVPEEMSVEEAEENTNSIYPDNEEIFADHFKLYYKDGLPDVEYATIDNIKDNNPDNLTSIIRIKEYKVLSSGEQIKISLTKDNKQRYEGGILTIGDQNYVVKNIEVFTKTDDDSKFDYALIEVLKKEVSDSIHADGDATIDSDQIKPIVEPENKLCTLVQNMQTVSNWHQPEINFKIQYPAYLNTIHREVIKPENQNTNNLQLEKTRGIWESALIERVLEDTYVMNANGSYKLDEEENVIPFGDQRHLGLYKITFPSFNLPQHPQFSTENENSVEWFNGIVRLFTKSSQKAGSSIPVKSRKEFKVVRVEKEDLTGDLVLTVNDTNFKLGNFIEQTIDRTYDEIIVGTQYVNYYPSYKVYLYADSASGITKENIQPRASESTHYSIFGISTGAVRPTFEYKSKISIPSPMYAVKIEKPVKPEEIKCDSFYATRPDFYNRSTFTFTTKYSQDRKPYGALHYRANEESFFNVLYKRETIKTIREELKKLGGNDEVNFKERWENFLNFNELEVDGHYKIFPENQSETAFSFPLPDNEELIKLINDFIEWHNDSHPGTINDEVNITSILSLNQVIISKGVENPVLAVHFIEQAIHSAFVPLTEVPVIYEYIKGPEYTPTNKKQTIKDKNGHALKPTDTDFDIAPMMKIVNATENTTQFTDFNLDGNSQSIYFYAVREMDIKMNFGEFSDLLGPVKLVSTTPPKMPEIKRIMPILENQVLGIKPAIQFELNAYQPENKIRKINIYRATSMLDAQSIRTMTPVKEVLINEETLSNEFDNVWMVYDEFEDLESIPFGDGLFYRVTVSKEIEYADPSSTLLNPIITIDYAPSQPSKITATIIADNVSPESPVLEASGIETGTNGEILKPVIFSWEKTVHNGKYHLYKMNSQGNWEKILEKASNEINVNLPLLETKLATDELVIKNEDGERVYHHFKIISENSSGMFSSEEKILTL